MHPQSGTRHEWLSVALVPVQGRSRRLIRSHSRGMPTGRGLRCFALLCSALLCLRRLRPGES